MYRYRARDIILDDYCVKLNLESARTINFSARYFQTAAPAHLLSIYIQKPLSDILREVYKDYPSTYSAKQSISLGGRKIPRFRFRDSSAKLS